MSVKKFHQILVIVVIGLSSVVTAGDVEWCRLFRGPVVLYCYEKDIRYGNKIISIVDQALPVLSERFGLSNRPEITILVAPSQKIFDQITGGQIPEWGIAAAEPEQSVIFLKSPRIARPETDLKSAVIHELSHVLLSVSSRGSPIDRWFDEGLAMTFSEENRFFETLNLARAVFSGEIIKLGEVDDVLTFRRQKAGLAYQESLSAVQFLIDRFGSDALVGIIRKIGERADMDAAMQSVIGMGFGDFEDSWYQAMKIKYRWAIFLNFPFLISVLMVLLFLAAFFVTRWRTKKRKKVWEQEDLYGFKIIRHRVEYYVFMGFILVILLIPLEMVFVISNWLGWIVFSVFRVRRKVVLKNLRTAFPEKSTKSLKQIGLRTYQNFAKMVFEYSRFPLLKKETVLADWEVEGIEHVDGALERGNGAVLVAGHFGNWEYMGACLAQMGYPIAFLVGEQHNKLIDDMMNQNRELMGIRIIHMGIAVRGVMKTLRDNRIVALLSDQDAGRQGVFVQFFGKPSSTHQGPAIFALKTGAPIIFASAIRLPRGKHKMVFELLRFDYLDGITDKNIYEMTQAYTTLLENKIREYPDHWFWMHRRWKRKPLESQ
jgi:KDO2-lipid IV(A) lauroyltransferase